MIIRISDKFVLGYWEWSESYTTYIVSIFKFHALFNHYHPANGSFSLGKSVPPNVKFLVDDVEDEWGYEEDPFDFIHARYLAGGVRDMKKLLQQCYK